MSRRRKPRSLIDYLAYTAISVAGAWVLYEMRLHFLDQRVERVQEQFAKLAPGSPAPAPRVTTYQPTEAELQRRRAEAAAQAERARVAQAKQAAWEKFYEPPPRCIYPESSKRIEVCQANERKQRQAFELSWAQQAE